MKTSEFKTLARIELKLKYSNEEISHLLSLLLENRLNKSRLDLVREGDFDLSKVAEDRLRQDIHLLAQDIPIQYIIGRVRFFGLDLKVNKAVLIPRSETEELVTLIAEDYQANKDSVKRIIDFGTGSACIALAAAKIFPLAKLEAWEISESALAIAKENAELNRLKIEFSLKSMLSDKLDENAQFDLMISNPPYIPPSQKKEMENRVLEHEPGLALFVEEQEPLLFYQAIVNKAKLGLKRGGKLYFEINQYLAEETLALFDESYKAELLKDLNGNWRFIRAEKA